jgi:hypothetical protein
MPQNKQKRDALFDSTGQYRGLPGYRTRDNRSGFDPIDTPAESARMEGLFYRNVFTLRIRTKNVFYLVMMFLFGVLPLFGLAYFAKVIITGTPTSQWVFLIFLFPFIALTGAITTNLILSLLEIKHIIPPLTQTETIDKPHEKKLPKRRKDYK